MVKKPEPGKADGEAALLVDEPTLVAGRLLTVVVVVLGGGAAALEDETTLGGETTLLAEEAVVVRGRGVGVKITLVAEKTVLFGRG